MEETELREACSFYFKMLDYLDFNFDEDWLRSSYLAGRLNLPSGVQTYSVHDSPLYSDAFINYNLAKAEMILKNPLMEEN